MLKKLTEAVGISGYENEIRNTIYNEIKPFCTSIEIDNMGNMIAHKVKNIKYKNIVLSSHMDEVGLIITGITEDGYLKFDEVGGIDPKILPSQKVIVNGINGVISFKAIHLTKKEDREKAFSFSDLFIDIGTKNKKDALKYVMPGDYCSFDSDYIEFGDELVKSKALDDRAGCAILIGLLKQDFNCNIHCVFTVQEETGLRGAKIALNSINVDYAIVVECTTCNDFTSVPPHQKVTVLGQGPAITIADAASIANRELVDNLVKIAESEKIKFQYKKSTRGGNDAGAIHLANGGIKTATISIPCRYIHSPSSVMNMNDWRLCRNLLSSFLKDVK